MWHASVARTPVHGAHVFVTDRHEQHACFVSQDLQRSPQKDETVTTSPQKIETVTAKMPLNLHNNLGGGSLLRSTAFSAAFRVSAISSERERVGYVIPAGATMMTTATGEVIMGESELPRLHRDERTRSVFVTWTRFSKTCAQKF